MYKTYALGVHRDEAAPGGEGGGAPGASAGTTFDAAAFETKLTGTFQTMFNKFDKTLKEQSKTITGLQDQLKSQTPAPGSEGTEGTPPASGGSKALPPEVATEIKQMREKMARLEQESTDAKTARTAAENASRETNRVTAIKDVLNAIPFRDQTTRDDAFHMVATRVKYSEDGELIATADGTDITAKAFIEGYFNDKGRAHYLQPRNPNGGAGAKPAGGGSGGFNPSQFLSAAEIVKLTPEQKSAYLQNLANVATNK